MEKDTMEKCPKFIKCSAPFCPLDEQSLRDELWFPDEEICTSKKYGGHDWIKRQRKIAKKTKDPTSYFLFEMLERKCRICPGIIGFDPDKEQEKQLKNWLKNHPPLKELSEEEKTRFQERMKRVRALK